MVALSKVSNFTTAATLISGGTYQIHDIAGRCIDLDLNSSFTTNYVPIISFPCNGIATQLWHFNSTDGFKFSISNAGVPLSFLSFASAEAAGAASPPLRQQAMSHLLPILWNPVQIDILHTIFIQGPGTLTSWSASTVTPQGASPVTIETLAVNSNEQPIDGRQFFSLVGPL